SSAKATPGKAKAAKVKAAKAKVAKQKAAKHKEQERAQKARERAQLEKQRARERQAKEKELQRERAQREREREQRDRDRERERQNKAKEAKRLQAERERERSQAAKQKVVEQKRQKAEKERARKANEKERERLLKERTKEQARLKAEREAEKVRQKAEREAAKTRAKQEREQERLRLKAEREAERQRLREEAQRKKEAEAAAKRAAQDAYRKAKDTEKARIRQEREAARRALEVRVAKAAGRGVRGGVRTAGIRVYSPTAIPNQSGTSRSTPLQTNYARFANLREPRIDPAQIEVRPRTLPPPPPVAPPESIEDRYALVQQRLTKMDDAFRKEHEEAMLMSWIYHDSALEGSVYTFDELRAAILPSIAVVPDSSMQTAVDEIRRHKTAIDLINELGDKRRAPITIDVVKRLYLVFNPDEGDLKTVKYRKDIPQHRLYFHEYAAPDKIAYKVRQVFDWLAGPEPKKLKSPLKVAARVHYDLVRVFPFPTDSGKVARAITNILLLRSDYPPALIHSTERQRYYEALRGSLTTIVSMMQESILNALQSIEKKLDEAETRMRSFGS
ncbi:MAG TPA: Fic family protein, partial [Polyangiaceae bacterium]|nr:Fic family protein [Polyangiaceae bacterium]